MVLLTVVSLIVGLFVPNFFSVRNLNALISNTTIRFLIAPSVSGCLITKGTDLSAGRQVGLAARLPPQFVRRYFPRLLRLVPGRTPAVF